MNMKPQPLKKRIFQIVIILVILYCFLNVGINVDNGTIFVIFDKWDVMNADKMVIRDDGKEIVITDTELIQKVTKETLIAEMTDGKHPKGDRWIELYHNDTLVRRIQWNSDVSMVVYEKDAIHWIFPSFYDGKGYISVPWDLYQELKQIVDEQ